MVQLKKYFLREIGIIGNEGTRKSEKHKPKATIK